MKSVLAALIVLVALAALALGGALVLSESHGGMFPGLAMALGWLVLAAGNLLVLALNLLYWRLYGAPRWLRAIVAVQALPAAATLALAGMQLFGDWQDGRAGDQRHAIYQAIRADDARRLLAAQHDCGERCAALYLPDAQLLDAADAGAQAVASTLVGQHASVSSRLGREAMDLRTCEGSYLPGLNALSVAVARHDLAMVDILFPVSDEGARQEAMWLAAQLDHLDLVQQLAAKGVPLSVRGPVLAQNDTLLVAAARGAALTVGKWLIETRHMPVDAIVNGPDPYPGTAPVRALMGYASEVPGSPRIEPFLAMLVQHGAYLDARDAHGSTPLEEAVRSHQRRAAKLLLDAGAQASLLSADEQAALRELLAHPAEPPRAPPDGPGCVLP
jgi:hypothetical protein